MMRSRIFAFCALIAILNDACVVLAAKPVDAKQSGDAFAQCIVRRQPKFAEAWLAVLPGSPEEDAVIAASQKDFDACISKSRVVIDEVATSRSSLRGPVAEQLLERRSAKLPGTAPMPEDSSPWFSERVIAMPDGVMDRGELRTELFAHCVALNQWPETIAFLGTERGGASEMAAMKLLKPALGECLTAGTTVGFKPPTLRPMLANAVYHLVSTAPAVPAIATVRDTLAAPARAVAAVPARAVPVAPARTAPAAPPAPVTPPAPKLPYGLEGF